MGSGKDKSVAYDVFPSPVLDLDPTQKSRCLCPDFSRFAFRLRSPRRRRIDCLQSAFSLKIRLVLVSSSAIANHDVIITIRD